MLNYWNKIRFDQIKEGGSGAGASVESKKEPPAAPNPPATQEEGDQFDDLGYEKEPAAKPDDKPKADDKKAPDQKPDAKKEEKPEEIKDPATGYGDEPPKVDDPPPAPKVEGPAAEPDAWDKALEGLPKEDVARAKKFFVDNKDKSPEEMAKAFAALRKNEIAEEQRQLKDHQKEVERQVQAQRAAWHKELKEDKTFGGENFKRNVHNAEKVLTEFMPDTKKRLTETKGMLPPYVMRDLAKLHDHLYNQESLVTGDPKTNEAAKDQASDDPLDFYE
jgi:hypothetical protein